MINGSVAVKGGLLQCGVYTAYRVVMGYMAATALLIMWISNAASTRMMLPVGLAALALASGHIP
jgi:sodium-dependent dicarboxylate transporter 2/3/5